MCNQPSKSTEPVHPSVQRALRFAIQMQLKFCSQFFTRPHDWLCRNGSSTALHRQSEMTFTGIQCRRESITSSAWSSTDACIRLLRCTFKTCACQSQPLPVAVTCVQLLVVTYKSWQPKLLLLGPAASLRVPLNSGTVYHCHSTIRHWHLRNSAAGWKLKNSFV